MTMQNLTLSPIQQQIVDSKAAIILCLAGPGSGKSTTLVARVRRLINDGMAPGQIVTITFTNAAADVLQQRLGKEVKLGFIGTLHSFMLRMLRQHGAAIGLRRDLSVMDEEQADELLKSIVKEQKCRDSLTAIRECLTCAMTVTDKRVFSAASQTVVNEYIRRMAFDGVVDYDGILYFALKLILKLGSAVNPMYEFQALFVDEYQDSGDADALIYSSLQFAQKFYVGDVNQSIYGFRGANVRNIISLANTLKRHDYGEMFYLRENHRCADEVCTAANKMISHARENLQMFTASATGSAGEVRALAFANEGLEMKAMMCAINEIPLEDEVAVLVRTNALAKLYGDYLKKSGIEIQERTEANLPADWKLTKRLIAVLANPENDRLALDFLKLTRGERYASGIYLQALGVKQSINRYALKLPATVPLAAIPEALTRSSISPEASELVTTAITALPDGSDVTDLSLALMRLDTGRRDAGKGVFVGTIHESKGREFHHVFLPAFEQEIIPGVGKTRDPEEERRVAYVAITRARSSVTFSYCQRRINPWKTREVNSASPSLFLAEAGVRSLEL